MPRLLPLLVLLASFVPGAKALHADGAAPVDEAPRTLHERLGRPAAPEEARVAMREAVSAGPDALVALARALGVAGGRAAADTLSELLLHRDEGVRVAALQAATRVGLRSRRLRDRALLSLDMRSRAETRAALEALGALGDGRDMQRLLDAAAEGESADRRAAFRALRALTGAKAPYDVKRWQYLWRSMDERARAEVPRALDTIAARPGDAPAASHRAVVRRLGWAVLPLVSRMMKEWLRDADPRLQRHACGIAADLRLADLAFEVEQAGRFATDHPSVVRAAREALVVLGMTPGDGVTSRTSAPGGSAPPAGTTPEAGASSGEDPAPPPEPTTGLGRARVLAEALGAEEASVRMQALAKASELRLRTRRLHERVVACLAAPSPEERLAAIRALGAVGDGRDVPGLLDLAAYGAAQDREAALEAVGAILGLVPSRNTAAREAGWEAMRARADEQVPRALAGLEFRSPGADTSVHLETLRELGIVLVPAVKVTLLRWLEGPDDELRAAASTLAGELRLADLTPAIARLLVTSPLDPAVEREALRALDALGARR
ncbi:MAG: hypothetical protein ACYTG6_07975 [Planctomycetota bacterium]|jgi:hypothetical protein